MFKFIERAIYKELLIFMLAHKDEIFNSKNKKHKNKTQKNPKNLK